MSISGADNWDRVRQAFADQFEQDGSGFVYRRSQKGQAIRVSTQERDHFIEEFDSSLRRSKWIIYIGLIVVTALAVLVSLFNGTDVPDSALIAAVVAAMIPYFAYSQWAWRAPARELAGRTPVASARSPEEVQRLKFQRMKYKQLGMAALAGLGLPFLVSGKENVLSGWNRLWLVFGGALVLLAAVQALRKWQFERGNTRAAIVAEPSNWGVNPAPEESSLEESRNFGQLWRYLPFAILMIALGVIAYTSAGKRLVQTPGFWPIAVFAIGCWALFTVVRGFQTGRAEPMARGFYKTYERQSEPKRYWASMAWNGLMGCFLVSMPLLTYSQDFLDAYETRCDNAEAKYSPQDALAACNRLIDKRQSESGAVLADAFWGRGNAREAMHDIPGAIADYSAALRITPDSKPLLQNRAQAYLEERAGQLAVSDYNRILQLDPRDATDYDGRAYTYEWLLHDYDEAIRDYSVAIRMNPQDAVAFFRRGMCYGRTGDYENAVADLSAVIRLRPNDAVAYYFRAVGYRDLGDPDHAASDLATAERLNPSVVAQLKKNPSRA